MKKTQYLATNPIGIGRLLVVCCIFDFFRMCAMRKIIVLKWYSFVLSLSSVLYGLQLFLFPDILNNYRVYQIVSVLFDSHFVGSLFMILGMLKFIGVAFNVPMIKKTSLISLGFLWTLFGISFLVSPPPNTIWIFALCMALLSFGIGMREV